MVIDIDSKVDWIIQRVSLFDNSLNLFQLFGDPLSFLCEVVVLPFPTSAILPPLFLFLYELFNELARVFSTFRLFGERLISHLFLCAKVLGQFPHSHGL